MGQAAATPTTKYPSRFREPSENKDFFLALTEKLFIRRKVTAEEIARYGQYLWQGDNLADRLAHKFHEIGMQPAMKMLGEALGGRISKEAPAELKALMQQVETEPLWLNKTLLETGARLTQRSGMLGEYVLSCVSLMGGYRSGAANKPIAFTGQLDYMASRRLAETAKFSFDVTRSGGLERGAAGYKAAIKVRMMHAHVRMMLDGSPKWRHAEWGLPINQADLVATNVLFSAVYLGGLRVLGLQISDEESQGVMHLWRYIGWLMGVDENLLPITEEEGTRTAWLAGVTQPPVAPGETFIYEYFVKDAGTFWFHPHLDSENQIERGLYAPIVVRGADDIEVDAERMFVLDDVKVESTGKLSETITPLDLMVGRQGNVLLVNGSKQPELSAQAGARERWRLLNAANGTFFKVTLPGHKLRVIAWDGGLLPEPYETDALVIAQIGRAHV